MYTYGRWYIYDVFHSYIILNLYPRNSVDSEPPCFFSLWSPPEEERTFSSPGIRIMASENNDSESRQRGSSSRTSSVGSSLRRHSLSFSNAALPLEDDDLEDETVSEAGDIGVRALHSNRFSGSRRLHLSVDDVMENCSVMPIQEDAFSQSYGYQSRDPIAETAAFPVLPSTLGSISPLSTTAIIDSDEKKREYKKELPWLLGYISCLIHLAVFGILGVLTRYLLQKLFGPGVIGATGDQSYMYLDLPSNMVGSFLMGWWGVVFKGDISRVSDHLAIGLTTGYLGSLTTFSGWNQKMLDLSVQGRWVFAVLGFVIGLFLAAFSIIFGVETAQSLRSHPLMSKVLPLDDHSNSRSNWKADNRRCQLAVIMVLLLMLGLFWGISGALVKKEFHSGSSGAQLWLACIVGPVGVWIRWFLARLNGRGIGKAGSFKWVPFGTLIANVAAACVMAALATLKKAVKTKNCDTVANGIQFGLMGCLSTVSTFIAEFHAMRQSKHPLRAYKYALITMVMSFSLGTLIYSLPVWVKGYS